MSVLTHYLQDYPVVTRYLGQSNSPFYELLNRPLAITPVKSENGITAYLTYNGTKEITAPVGYGESVTTKLVLNEVDVVFWGDHPLEFIIEDAIEEGLLPEDYDDEQLPPNLEQIADGIIVEYVEEAFGEMAEQSVTVISEPRSFSPLGGWVVTARLSQPVSVAYSLESGQVKARTAAVG